MQPENQRGTNDYGALSCSLLTITTWLAQRRIDPATVDVTVNDQIILRELWDEYNIARTDRVRTVARAT